MTPLVKFSWKSSRNVIFWWDSGLEKSDRNSRTKATNYGEFPLTEWSAAVGGQIEAQRSQIIVTEPGLSLSHTPEVKILSIPRLEMRDCKSYVELILFAVTRYTSLSLSLCPNLQDAVSPPLLSTASHKFDISMKWLKDTEDRITKWWNRNSYFQLKNWFQRVELFISYNNTNNHISQLDQTYLSHWKRFRFEPHQMWYKGAQPCPCNGITIHTITPNK